MSTSNLTQTEYSIVIPVYGRGDCLSELVQRLDTTFNDLNWTLPEVLMIDDCGSNESWDRIQEITNCRKRTKAIQLSRNFGQHNAIMCGFHHATGDIIITMDDDLQQEPESMPKLIDALRVDDLDVVYGAYAKKQHAFGRNIGSNLVNRFYRLIFKSPVTVTSYRAIRRQLVCSILRYELNFTYIDGLLAWNTTRIGTVDIPHHERRSGQSGYTLSKLLALAMNIFTNFSLLPLQLVSLLGITSAFLGIGLGGWYAIAALLTNVSVPGYASTIVAVLVLGGFQLLSLGIMGEYIGRLHLNVNRKPQFNIRKTTENASGRE